MIRLEILLVIVIIMALCAVLGVGTEFIALGIFALTVLAALAMFALFTYCIFNLFLAKKLKAEFVKIAKKENGRFNKAYYLIDKAEIPCLFPCESFFKKKLYRAGKMYTVRLSKNGKFVFDRFSTVTCILGFAFSLAFTAFFAWLAVELFIIQA